MVAGRLPSKLHPKMLRRKVFAVPGGTSAQLAFVVSCMETAAPRRRTPGLACSNELLNSLLEVVTAFGIWLTIRANHNAKSAPFEERQAALRVELRARLNSQFRLVRAVDNVDRGLLPGSPVEADLDELRTYLNAKKDRFMVPTPEQIEVVIKSIDSALAALAVAHHPPRNDTVFIPHVDEIKCNVLRPWLEKALADINVLLDGLAAIARQPMSVRRQSKLFAALNPENQTSIEV